MELNDENSNNEDVWEVDVNTTNTTSYMNRATEERRKYGRVLPLTQMVLQNTSWADRPVGSPRRAISKVQPRTPKTYKIRPRFEPSPSRQKRPGVSLNVPNQKRSKGGKRKTYRRRK